jgi:isoamyl acetate esterase
MSMQISASSHASTSEPSATHAYPQIALFGDSITEGSEATFAAALRQEYVRKADIINRGFSGYTSQLALDVLPKWFPLEQTTVRLMTVFFGAGR